MKHILAAAAIALTSITGAAQAQDYPERPVMMMVSYGAGGATDFQARIVTMTAGNEDALGMPIAIINKPGAGGRVGWNWLATQAEADGYTMGAYNVPHFIAQSIEGGVEYSTDSFEPIANWGADPAVFVVGADSLSDAFRAQAAGNVKILGVFDLERNEFLPDVPTLAEQGFDIDNASVNFRGVMVPKGTPQDVIDKLAATVPEMFKNGRVAGKMKAGGSPMHIMTRDEVLEMWAAREVTLKELLAGL